MQGCVRTHIQYKEQHPLHALGSCLADQREPQSFGECLPCHCGLVMCRILWSFRRQDTEPFLYSPFALLYSLIKLANLLTSNTWL